MQSKHLYFLILKLAVLLTASLSTPLLLACPDKQKFNPTRTQCLQWSSTHEQTSLENVAENKFCSYCAAKLKTVYERNQRNNRIKGLRAEYFVIDKQDIHLMELTNVKPDLTKAGYRRCKNSTCVEKRANKLAQ